MIVVRVELHHATQPGKVTELARMHIANDGTSAGTHRNYIAKTFRGRTRMRLNQETISRTAELKNWPSERFHVWFLVSAILKQLGYADSR